MDIRTVVHCTLSMYIILYQSLTEYFLPVYFFY